MIFGGDFRQILPVTKRGNRSAIVKSCINRASFWKFVKIFKLTPNMRIRFAAINSGKNLKILNQFSDFLLSIGDGLIPDVPNSKFSDEINIPFGKNMDEIDLINLIYPNIKKVIWTLILCVTELFSLLKI